MLENGEVIAAISTPVGEGGIGIVRLSGPGSFDLVQNIFYPQKTHSGFPRNQRLYYGYIKDSKDEVIDEALVSFMRKPWTYTREDIVEINCHSGMLTLKMILELVLINGARLARPGEFTRRAFMNGRIDLSQAESVFNLVHARSEKALKAAASNLGGNLSNEVTGIRMKLIEVAADVDACLDFPDEVESIDPGTIQNELEAIHKQILGLLHEAEKGLIYQEGLRVAIAGKPNVGKSSLLNRFLRKQRAIVTDIPGTTRDLLEEYVNILGVPVKLIDTAGIRKPQDPIEFLGVERAREVMDVSDVVILLIDASTGISQEDLDIIKIIERKQNKTIVAINKIDLMDVPERNVKSMLPDARVIKISVKENLGLDALEKLIVSMVESEEIDGFESPMVVSMRHKEALSEANDLLSDGLHSVKNDLPDMLSIDLKMALNKLGEITGETANDEILDRIFSSFCIGK